MSSSIKRTLKNLTNENKRFKNDSAIDLNFDIGEFKNQSSSISSESFVDDDSMFECGNDDDDDDDDDVFEDDQNIMISLSKTSQTQGRKRLNGTSSYRMKENKNKRKSKYIKKEHVQVDQTLDKLREEQARIDAHSLSVTAK